MENTPILKILIIYLTCLIHCVSSTSCKINKFNFIGNKLNDLSNFKTNHYRNTPNNTPVDVDSSSTNTSTDSVKYNSYNVDETIKQRLFNTNNQQVSTLKPPLKSTLDSLIPEIFRVFDARKKLGYSPLPSLLCCSGGVDSMSLLHSFGLIKQNYEYLVHNRLVQTNFTSFSFNTGSSSSNTPKNQTVIEIFDDFFKTFNVVYFNHKQRDDVDKDIEVIRAACDEYQFNLLIEELPSSTSLEAEGKATGFQNVFRLWRRETSIKLINQLHQSIISSNSNYKDSPSSTSSNTPYSTLRNQFEFRALNDSELENIKSLNDIADLKGLVFMAHNLDDNFETLLLKILRGSFISNLTPMEMYDILDHKEYLLVRPFINLKKSKLISFIQDLNETYHEDSSNSKLKYTRNIMRNLIIPELFNNLNNNLGSSNEPNSENRADSRELIHGLPTKFKHLSKQCNSLRSLLDHEVDMFYHYVDSKYNTSTSNAMYGSRPIDPFDSVKEAYKAFYSSLFTGLYGGSVYKLETGFQHNMHYLEHVGLKFDHFFHLKDWTIIPSRLIKEQVLLRFIVEKTGSGIFYKNLRKLVTDLSNAPYSDSLRMYSVGNHLLHHQAYYLKLVPNTHNYRGAKKSTPPADAAMASNRKLIHSDDSVNIYNCIEKLNMAITQPYGNYFVNLILDPTPYNGLNNYGQMNNYAPNLGFPNVADTQQFNMNDALKGQHSLGLDDPQDKLELEIRYLREDDVATSRKLWTNSASNILTNIKLQKFLKDEIPAIVIAGTSNVIGLYGYNLYPPYHNRESQTIHYQTDLVAQRSQYTITIL